MSTDAPGVRAPRPRRRIEPWAVIPAVFFLVLVGAYLAFIGSLADTDVSSVAEEADLEPGAFDRRRAAAERFATAGLRLVTERLDAPGRVRLRLDGAAASRLDGVRVRFYRASSRGLDQDLAWDEPGEPLAIGLPRAGAWRITVTATLDGEAVREAVQVTL